MARSPLITTFRRVARDLPFGELAATLLLFTHRLHHHLRDHGATDVSFLAREGRVLKDALDVYAHTVVPSSDRTPTRYLMVSRRALYTPSLAPEDFSFTLLRSNHDEISVLGFLMSLGADVRSREVERLAQSAATVPELVASEDFRAWFETHRQEQRDLAERYLSDSFRAAGPRLHVVDVGWKGSIQDFLRSIARAELPISGWYLGLGPTDVVSTEPNSSKRGLVFEAGPPPSAYFNVFAHFKSLYETLLNADHGSVVRFRDADGSVVPVLDPLVSEVEQQREIVMPVQRRILDVFVSLCESLGDRLDELPTLERDVAHLHARMMFRPRRDEVELVDRLLHYENFGEVTIGRRGRGARQRPRLASVVRGPGPRTSGALWRELASARAP